MNLTALTPKNIEENFMILNTENTGTFVQQTQTEAQETLVFQMKKSRKSF